MPLRNTIRSLTQERTALELFTDRQYACRLFEAYLDAEPPRGAILFFHGDGGNGKSLLLRFLYENYCLGSDPRRWADAPPDPAPRRRRRSRPALAR